MGFQTQERPHGPANMVTLCLRTSRLAALHPTELLEPPMILFNCPHFPCHIRSFQRRHRYHVRCPVFRVTVWGVKPEDLDQSVPFQMHHRSVCRDSARLKRSVPGSIRVNMPISFQARKPVPVEAANRLEVLQAAVPTVEGDKAREKAALLGGLEHGTEMSILGQTIHRLVIEPIVAWDGVCAITPEQGDQIDATHHTMVLARPVAMDEGNLLGIRLVERSIVDDQETIMQDDMLLGFVPERRRIGVEAMEQAGQGIMSSASRRVGLNPGGFRAREDERGGNQKVDVIEVSDFGLVHISTIPQNASTA